jgi:hypothetical protein
MQPLTLPFPPLIILPVLAVSFPSESNGQVPQITRQIPVPASSQNCASHSSLSSPSPHLTLAPTLAHCPSIQYLARALIDTSLNRNLVTISISKFKTLDVGRSFLYHESCDRSLNTPHNNNSNHGRRRDFGFIFSPKLYTKLSPQFSSEFTDLASWLSDYHSPTFTACR